MSKREKIVERILNDKTISFEEAKSLLIHLGYIERSRGSHHSFSKVGQNTLTLTNKREMKKYQLRILKEVLENHGY